MFKHGRRLTCLQTQTRAFHRSSRWSSTPLPRVLSILAIESSCDDSSVAILDLRQEASPSGVVWRSKVVFHDTITAQSQQYGGIHPLVALTSHNTELAKLVQRAMRERKHADPQWTRPSVITATRGPGMRSNLAVGLSVGKGLAIAWDVPFIGTHHMQAHALTPRLCWTLDDDGEVIDEPSKTWAYDALGPRFPYLSVLVSGGHTMLLQSSSVVEHTILAETRDIALGDCLDKAARAILPSELCKPPYGKALEEFAFPNCAADYNYTPPINRQAEIDMKDTPYGWGLRPPLQESRQMAFSFAGLLSSVERLMRPEDYRNIMPGHDPSTTSITITTDERRYMAREVLRICFEHLASRILIHFKETSSTNQINTIVVSGGVASNNFLRFALRKMLDVRGFPHVQVVFPPIKLCTDNALMIAWAAFEMYMNGYTTDLGVEPLRKWSMDSSLQDGGILGVSGWLKDATGASMS